MSSRQVGRASTCSEMRVRETMSARRSPPSRGQAGAYPPRSVDSHAIVPGSDAGVAEVSYEVAATMHGIPDPICAIGHGILAGRTADSRSTGSYITSTRGFHSHKENGEWVRYCLRGASAGERKPTPSSPTQTRQRSGKERAQTSHSGEVLPLFRHATAEIQRCRFDCTTREVHDDASCPPGSRRTLDHGPSERGISLVAPVNRCDGLSSTTVVKRPAEESGRFP